MEKKNFFVVSAFFILFSCAAILVYAEPELTQGGADYRIADGVPVKQFQQAENAQLDNIEQAEQLNQDIESQNFTVSYATSISIPQPPPIGPGENPIVIPSPLPLDINIPVPPPVFGPRPGNAPEVEEPSWKIYLYKMQKMIEQMKKWFEEQMKK